MPGAALKGPAKGAKPAAGSYAAAILRLFEPGSSEEAHAAARRLKTEVMQHNLGVAQQFLRDTAATAAAAAAAADKALR